MALPMHLSEALIAIECPRCGFAQSKKVSWLKTAQLLKCPACGTETPVTYNAKIRLFERAAREAKDRKRQGPELPIASGRRLEPTTPPISPAAEDSSSE